MKNAYICEKCGEVFLDWHEADGHERKHINPDTFYYAYYMENDINKIRWPQEVESEQDQYPSMVVLPMADGAKVRYVIDKRPMVLTAKEAAKIKQAEEEEYARKMAEEEKEEQTNE